MNTQQRPIITPANHDGDEREHTAEMQRGRSTRNVDAESEMRARESADRDPMTNEAQSPAPAAGEYAPSAELGTPHLPEEASTQANERWQRIQAQFVDDPRKSVAEAHALVGELVQHIVAGFERERDGLESQWSKGDDVSTENLRLCLQNYRSFFSRLLPSAGGIRRG
jgi:hypothetical protein